MVDLCGTNDGAEGGVGFGAPLAAEPVGDLAEDDAGAEMPLGDVVGVRDCPIGHEHEQVGPVGKHPLVQLAAGLADRNRRYDAVESAVKIVEILL